MSWIKNVETEKKENKILKLSNDIEKNNIELGRILKEIKEKGGSLDCEEYGINDSKVNQLIKNYEFFEKHKINGFINLSKLTLLTKFEHHKNIKEFIEFSLGKTTLKELRTLIFGEREGKIITKRFKFNEETQFLYEESKKIVEKITGKKMSQNEVMENILMDFYSTNVNLP